MAQTLSNLVIGAKIKFGKYRVGTEEALPMTWSVIGKESGYIILHADKALDFKRFDPSTTTYFDLSEIDSFLNGSSGSADTGTPYFLYYLSDDESGAVLNATLSIDYGSGGVSSWVRRAYLLSYDEFVKYYSGNNLSGIGYASAQAIANSSVSGKPSGTGTPVSWWLRDAASSPYQDDRVAVIGTDGKYSSYGVQPDTQAVGLRPAIRIKPSAPVSDTLDSDGYYTFAFNRAPGTPEYFNVPEKIYGGKAAALTWGASVDPDGNLAGYILQRALGDGAYSQIYKGTARAYSDTVDYGQSKVRYRVCAYDSDGKTSAYLTVSRTVISNHAPAISGSDRSLGTVSGGFDAAYTVSDSDSDTLTVTEVIDGNITVRTYTPTLGASNTASIKGETWLKLSNGAHTLTITATDPAGDTAVRKIYFTRAETAATVVNQTPYSSGTRPVRIKLTVARSVPEGAVFKVYVTNNGFDASPVWEDATSSVTANLAHVFTNTTKTAAAWGVCVKVSLTRGTAVGACYISRIGGNFE